MSSVVVYIEPPAKGSGILAICWKKFSECGRDFYCFGLAVGDQKAWNGQFVANEDGHIGHVFKLQDRERAACVNRDAKNCSGCEVDLLDLLLKRRTYSIEEYAKEDGSIHARVHVNNSVFELCPGFK